MTTSKLSLVLVMLPNIVLGLLLGGQPVPNSDSLIRSGTRLPPHLPEKTPEEPSYVVVNNFVRVGNPRRRQRIMNAQREACLELIEQLHKQRRGSPVRCFALVDRGAGSWPGQGGSFIDTGKRAPLPAVDERHEGNAAHLWDAVADLVRRDVWGPGDERFLIVVTPRVEEAASRGKLELLSASSRFRSRVVTLVLDGSTSVAPEPYISPAFVPIPRTGDYLDKVYREVASVVTKLESRARRPVPEFVHPTGASR